MPAAGALDCIELPGPNIAASKRFYADVFGWKFTDDGPGYAAFETPDGRQGGFNAERKAIGDGGALVVLYANGLDSMEERVRAAGADILSRNEFPGGRRFHFRHPNGNAIAVWTKS